MVDYLQRPRRLLLPLFRRQQSPYCRDTELKNRKSSIQSALERDANVGKHAHCIYARLNVQSVQTLLLLIFDDKKTLKKAKSVD